MKPDFIAEQCGFCSSSIQVPTEDSPLQSICVVDFVNHGLIRILMREFCFASWRGKTQSTCSVSHVQDFLGDICNLAAVLFDFSSFSAFFACSVTV